jgi:flagellar hook-length control protein FliK
MAADAVPMTLSGGGSVSQPTAKAPAAGSPGGPDLLSGCSPSGSGPGSADARPMSANTSESHAGRASSDQSARSGEPAADAADSSASAQPRAAQSGTAGNGPNSRRPTSSPGKPGRGASAASSSRSAPAAENATLASTDFSAALAQSLAATPAGPAASAAGTAAGRAPSTLDATAGGAAGESGESGPKHSTTDPVSSALSLLEQALAGALTAIPPAPVTSGPGPAPAGGSSCGSLLPDALGGRSAAAALNALLPHNALLDRAAPAGAAAAAGASGTAAATLTAAAQLSSAVPVGLTHGTADPSAMALSSRVGTPAWTEELGAKMTWMSSQGIDSASLRLSPEHLGPLQVTISVHDGQASVWFGAAQPETRTALQQSLPQLRQLFAGQGLTLADAGVSREPPRGQTRQPAAGAVAPTAAAVAISSDGSAVRAPSGGLGLLDTYA